MYRQDKATTERHARILRELVKRPENKTCADCKRQDARWSSWNIGVFICIRCSGVHRSMGTHISKVKSVDLDTWTPEQMESIQKWGNHRANLYWEAHLRPGHIPPEHKVDSFIRSKYESRRWARDGPPPSDPSVLESAEEPSAETNPAEAPVPIPEIASPPLSSPPPVTSRQPQPHSLLSAAIAGRPSVVQLVQAAAAQHPKAPDPPRPDREPQNDLFSLDFHAPTPTSVQQQAAPKKDVKNNILSLFSASPPATTVPTSNAAFRQYGTSTQWSQPQAIPQTQPQSISMMGTSGTAMWGAQSGWVPPTSQAQPDVWNGFQDSSVQAAPVIAQQPSTQSLYETRNVWDANSSAGASISGGTGKNDVFGSSFASTPAPLSTAQKKDDVFGDLWGDFR